MNQLHPQDLRTIVAAVSWLTHFRNPKDALNCADEILAELERTAKPEPARTCSEVDETAEAPCPCGANDWKRWDTPRAGRVPFCRACGWMRGTHPDTPKAEPDPGWIARLTQARKDARAEGAREERKRIVSDGIYLVADGPYTTRLITMEDLDPKP